MAYRELPIHGREVGGIIRGTANFRQVQREGHLAGFPRFQFLGFHRSHRAATRGLDFSQFERAGPRIAKEEFAGRHFTLDNISQIVKRLLEVNPGSVSRPDEAAAQADTKGAPEHFHRRTAQFSSLQIDPKRSTSARFYNGKRALCWKLQRVTSRHWTRRTR